MATLTTAPASTDERITRVGPLRRLLLKPELGALIGAIIVFIFFAVLSDVFRAAAGIAKWLDPASTLGIMADAAAPLVIGGRLDPSARPAPRDARPTPPSPTPP